MEFPSIGFLQTQQRVLSMGLQEEITQQSAQIKTDSYPMSIGEMLNLYRDNDLDVHPEFQRVFRWTGAQKTRLIESILLGIPIPPIFVAQRKDGVWDVVDGVQRLSTIFQFVGVLKKKDGTQFEPLVLEKTKFLPSLQGKSWDALDQEKPENAFTAEQKRYVKRAKIDVNIVLKESDDKSKYELFMRLNTGGSVLEPQEVRNCLMIMAYQQLYDWIEDLSKNEDFLQTIDVSEPALAEQYPMELVTRFLCFRTLPEQGEKNDNGDDVKDTLSSIVDIGDYLNDRLESLHNLSQQEKDIETKAFNETFRILNNTLQSDVFRKYDKTRSRFLGAFSISSFETIALGIGFNAMPDGHLPAIPSLKEKIQSIWDDQTFLRNSGSGVRASSRIPWIVPLGRKLFKP